MRKILRFILSLAALGMLVYGGMNLAIYLLRGQESAKVNQQVVASVVATRPAETVPTATAPSVAETEPEETGRTTTEKPPISVDFDILHQMNADIVGWLYCEDTPINLPVVRGEDNDFYLDHLFDRTGNASGTLFADYRSSPDFSDVNTVIYGHNLKNGSMFRCLTYYKEQEYYDEHPTMWLLTPEGDYRVDVLAGLVTGSKGLIYTPQPGSQEMQGILESCLAASTFVSNVTAQETDRFLTLSTCTYDFDEARYVLIGYLVSCE